MIVNTHPSNQPGEHWLAIYITDDGIGRFYDSFGNPPDFTYFPKSIKDFLKTCENVEYSSKQVQDLVSTTCGQHCLFFLFLMTKGLSYKDFMSFYADDLRENDALVSKFVAKMYQSKRDKQMFNCIQHAQSCETFNLCHGC